MKSYKLAIKSIKKNWKVSLLTFLFSVLLLSTFIFSLSYHSQISKRIEVNKEKIMSLIFPNKSSDGVSYVGGDEGANQRGYFYKGELGDDGMALAGISYDYFQEYVSSDYVKDAYYSSSFYTSTRNKIVDDTVELEVSVYDNYGNEFAPIYVESSTTPGKNVLGSDIDEIIEGRMPKNKPEIAVSEKVAQRYGVSIGDTFSLKENYQQLLDEGEDGIDDDTWYVESLFEVVGITKENTYITNDATNEFTIRIQQMYLSTDGQQAEYLDFYHFHGDVAFFLKDYNDFDAFIREVEETDSDLASTLSYDTKAYQQLVNSLETTNKRLEYFMIIMSIVTGLLLLFVSIYEYHKRKKDFTILELQGMRKNTILKLVIIEKLYIVLTAVIVSVILFVIAAQPLLDQILLRAKNEFIGESIFADFNIYTGWSSNFRNLSLYDKNLLKAGDMQLINVSFNNISWIYMVIVSLVLIVWSNIFVAISVVRNKKLRLGRERI